MAGKYSAPKKSHWAPFVVILAVAALVATIGGSMAWLTDSQGGLTNTFTPATVSGQIVEDFSDPTVKKNVGVKNTSDVPVYVRVALVPTWVNTDTQVPVAESCDLSDIKIKEFADSSEVSGNLFEPAQTSNWVKGADGYFYYKLPVASQATTDTLFVQATAVTAPNGCSMNLQVLMQIIQAEPVNAVKDAWKVDPTTGNAVE